MLKNTAYAGIVMLSCLTLASQDASASRASLETSIKATRAVATGCPYLISGYRDSVRKQQDFSTAAEVEDYVKSHPGIGGIGLVHHGCFPTEFPLSFLNDHSNINKLVLRGDTLNSSTFNLSSLLHITSFTNNLYNDHLALSFDNMPKLIELDTYLEYFKYLGNMPALRSLSLSKRPWTPDAKHDISGIERYNLSSLTLESEVADYEPLGKLGYLEYLRLEGCRNPHNYEFIRHLKNLRSLKINLAAGQMDLSVLEGLPKLEHLELEYFDANNNGSSLNVLGSLPNLKTLILRSASGLNDISALSRCRKLEVLNLWFSSVTSLEPLRGLPVKKLDIGLMKVKDLSPLADMRELELLNMPSNYPQSWEGLREHPSLRRINLSEDHILWSMTNNVDPLQIFQTIPNLELLNMQTTWLPAVLLEKFKESRPEVILRDYSEWEGCSLSQMKH